MATKNVKQTHSKQLREWGLNYPGAHTKSPWPGHLDLAVKDKTFAYLSPDDEPFGISCKLPSSCSAALMFPFCEPTPYGLGKSGWVSAKFNDGDKLPPLEMFKAWIDESYRSQAPKTFVKSLAHAPGTIPDVITTTDGAKSSSSSSSSSSSKPSKPSKSASANSARSSVGSAKKKKTVSSKSAKTKSKRK